ncbi:hypothetical protein HHY15_002333 [Salmonella enterica]|nr:hypothetical protein [Salmonella enterica]EGG8436806.1 hypothetical protein [Salmonella enterica]EJP8211588.1 hypothetical protein [Salmonella enterica]
MNKEMKENIIRLKRSGIGYKAISRETEININTVKSICRRSGLFRDNPEHRALFTIPEPKYSTELATIKPLPPQQVITGHKQTDAYLWVLEVIKLNEPAHLEAAQAALEKLTITPKEAQDRYTRYLQSNGVDGFNIVFGTMMMDNPQHFIERAREQAARAAEVRGVFGSYEAIYDKLTVPEQLLEDALGWLYNDSYGWTEEEKRQGRIEGKRVIEVMELREKKCFEIITDVLPAPFTLSDVVREFQYWEWVYRMRDAAKKEIAPNELSGDGGLVSDRESWLDKQLEIIRPVSRDEALNVLRWYLRSERHQGFMDADSDAVYLNLIGAHNAE